MGEEMTLGSALSIYFSQAESSREGWHDADDETWDEAEQLINKHRKDIFKALKLQELVKERIKKETHIREDSWSCMRTIHDTCSNCDAKDLLQSLVEESEK